MIKTYGLTHIALPVKDVKRTSKFYQKLFGVKEMYSSENFIQVQTPGSKDIIVFEKQKKATTSNKKIGLHFGFRLQRPSKVTTLINAVRKAGGRIRESGEFVPGEPYLFLYDPDGYEVEIWFEKIPPSLKKFQ